MKPGYKKTICGAIILFRMQDAPPVLVSFPTRGTGPCLNSKKHNPERGTLNL
jgi:hypothetical protein